MVQWGMSSSFFPETKITTLFLVLEMPSGKMPLGRYRRILCLFSSERNMFNLATVDCDWFASDVTQLSFVT